MGNINMDPGSLLSQEPPLPGGFIRGDVWATADITLQDQDIVAVKKHTKGSLLGPSVNAPAERLSVAWEHRADGEAGNINMDPGSLTSREPPLPGGFIRGDVVWATSDLPSVKPLGGQGSKMVMVKKHTKGSILGSTEVDPTQLLVSWEDQDNSGKAESTLVSPDKLTIVTRATR